MNGVLRCSSFSRLRDCGAIALFLGCVSHASFASATLVLTGIDFSIGGAALALTSKTGIERTVAGDGTFVDTGSAQNLTWSLTSQGSGNYQLDFSPDATDAILGPPSSGSYAGANSSIKGNAGHNPFAAITPIYVVTGAGITTNSTINVTHFLYGTGPDPANGTITYSPEPSTLVLMCLGAAIVAFRRKWSKSEG